MKYIIGIIVLLFISLLFIGQASAGTPHYVKCSMTLIQKGNGEVWYVKPQSGTGITSATKVVRVINPVCGKRIDRFIGKGVVKA